MLLVGLFFVCKQKTAYEMRISDWSSDVCSSDLAEAHRASGLDNNLPKMTLADGIDGSSHMVLSALARAAGNYQHLVSARRLSQGLAHAIRPIRQKDRKSVV